MHEELAMMRCDQCGKRRQWDKMIYVPGNDDECDGYFVCSEECKGQFTKGKL